LIELSECKLQIWLTFC